MEDILLEIRKDLMEQADEKTLASFQRFFKEGAKARGVKTAMVTRLAKKYFKLVKPLGKRAAFALCEELLKSDYTEDAFIASEWAYWLRDEYEEGDFEVFQSWLGRYINNWAKCDSLCNHAVGSFVEKFPQFIDNLKSWTSSHNLWLRRASAVTLIVPAREGRFLRDVFEISDRLLSDKEDLVQKGYGWLLKEASHEHRNEVFDYVMKHKTKMPRTALRYAIEKLPEDMRKQAMSKE